MGQLYSFPVADEPLCTIERHHKTFNFLGDLCGRGRKMIEVVIESPPFCRPGIGLGQVRTSRVSNWQNRFNKYTGVNAVTFGSNLWSFVTWLLVRSGYCGRFPAFLIPLHWFDAFKNLDHLFLDFRRSCLQSSDNYILHIQGVQQLNHALLAGNTLMFGCLRSFTVLGSLVIKLTTAIYHSMSMSVLAFSHFLEQWVQSVVQLVVNALIRAGLFMLFLGTSWREKLPTRRRFSQDWARYPIGGLTLSRRSLRLKLILLLVRHLLL